MGKIQNARGKKNGVNLRRSLLVSKVLFRAKTAVIMAKYNLNNYEFEQAPAIDDASDESDDETDNADQEVPDIAAPAAATDEQPETDTAADDVIAVEAEKATWKANNVLTQSSENVVVARTCSKRRASEVESAVASILTPSPPPAKRPCVDVTSPDSTSDSPLEPMDYSSAQVNILVNSFSCGFSGLVTSQHSISENCDVTSCSSSQQREPVSEQSQQNNSSSELSRSHSSLTLSDAFTSCSNQIKDALAVTSPAPIALSV